MSAPAFKIGDRISGKYEIVSPLGSGAHGTVYLAVQHPVGRTVALKFISKHLSSEAVNRDRFFHEARALARLNHPAVVTLYDYGEAEGLLFMVMEYIEGEELSKVISDEAPLAPIRVMHLAQHMLSALIEAHELGLVHRDLKPANVMVHKGANGEERVKIVDFGIAALREESLSGPRFDGSRPLGTPAYTAPEQALGRPVGPAADLYSLGIILYEMLTGRPPFESNSPWMIIDKHVRSPVPMLPPELGVPASLETLVRLALAKEPEARFPDARSMLTRLLETFSDHERPSAFVLPTLRELPVADRPSLSRLIASIEQQADEKAAAKRERVPSEPGITSLDAVGALFDDEDNTSPSVEVSFAEKLMPTPRDTDTLPPMGFPEKTTPTSRPLLLTEPEPSHSPPEIDKDPTLPMDIPAVFAPLGDPARVVYVRPNLPAWRQRSFWVGVTVNSFVFLAVWLVVSALSGD